MQDDGLPARPKAKTILGAAIVVGRKAALLPEACHPRPDAVLAAGAARHAVNQMRPHNGPLPNYSQSGPPLQVPSGGGARDLHLKQ